LWDQPQLAHEVPAGQHWLPGTVTGGRETLMTRARSAAPWHVLPLPGDSWWPVLAAAGTAGFFLLLTVGWSVPAWTCALLAVIAIVRWLWQLDRAPALSSATIGTGVAVPVRVHGRGTPAWWGTVVLVVVNATVFASMLFAHVHVSLQSAVCPPPGAQLPAGVDLWGAALAGLLGSIALALAQRACARAAARRGVIAALVLATTASGGAFVWLLSAFIRAGLNPSAEAWSATVAALLGLQGVHTLALLLIGAYLVVRAACGLLRPQARASIDCSALLWHWTTLQGWLLIGAVTALPRLLNG
jgi:cytochrome c oxidase subunit I+III